MANTTNFNWETPDDTDLVKDGAAAIRTLGSSIDTTTKNLNPQTTTGAIAYRSATANVNTSLPIGTTGQVLTVAAGVPSWATASASDAGLVFINSSSFTSSSTVTLDSVFSATYNNYKIVISCTGSTSGISVAMRLRVGGSTNSSSNYNQLQVIQATGNYYAATATQGNTSWPEVALLQTGNPRASVFMELYNPFATTNTAGLTIFSKSFTTSPEFQLYAWGNSVTTSYDGFALIPSTGNITGTVAVYGMRNS